MRLFALAALTMALALAAAAPAGAAVVPLASAVAGDVELALYALAGDEALLARTAGRRPRVIAVPADGGAPVERLRLPAGPRRSAAIMLAGSPSTAAAVALSGPPGQTQLFAGPAGAPLAPASPAQRRRGDDWIPLLPEVVGDRILVGEFREEAREGFRYVVHEPRPGERPVIPIDERTDAVAFGGDLMAAASPVPGAPRGAAARRLVVSDWRTGTERWSTRLPGGVDALDVHRDGRVLVGEGDGGVVEVAAGGTAVRQVAARGADPAYAGDAVVFLAGRERFSDPPFAVAAPDGSVRRFGVPTARRIDPPAVDEKRVVWRANGCLLSATLDSPPETAIGEGPCRRTETAFAEDASQKRAARGHRRLRIVLACVAAPPPGCRGAVALDDDRGRRAAARRRFAIAAGQRADVGLRLTRRGYARARRRGLHGFVVEAVSTDPAGRRTVLRDDFGLRLPRP